MTIFESILFPMEFIQKMDPFEADLSFNIKGTQVVSGWCSKLFCLISLALALALSLSMLQYLWMPLSQIPITTQIVSTDGLWIDPFVIGFTYLNQGQMGTAKYIYDDGTSLDMVDCPVQVFANWANTECFLTKPMDFVSTGNITVTMTTYVDVQSLIEVFSLGHEIQNKSRLFISQILNQGTTAQISVTFTQLQIIDSLISDSPTKTFGGIQSMTALMRSKASTQESRAIIYSQNQPNCLQYQVNRLNLLTIISAATSWLQNICSIIAVLFLFNISTLKQSLSTSLYNKDHLDFTQGMQFRVWLYGKLQLLHLGVFLRERYGWFKSEHIIYQIMEGIDRKLALNNILRLIPYLKSQNTVCLDNSKENDSSNGSSVAQPGFLIEDASLGFSYYFQQHQVQKSIKARSLDKTLPENSSPIWARIVRVFNVNSREVSLGCQAQDKSSVFSVIMTIIGIGIVVPILYYLGALTVSAQSTSSVTISESNSLQFDSLTNPLYFRLTQGNIQVFDDSLTIYLVMFDENYQITQTYLPSRNCTSEWVGLTGIVFNYCINSDMILKRNMTSTVRLGLKVNQTSKATLQLTYLTTLFKTNLLQTVIQSSSFVLESAKNYQGKFTIINQKRDGVSSKYHTIRSILPTNPHFCDYDDFCMAFTLPRQEYSLEINSGSVAYFLQNIWSISYIFFTFIITLLILPYNHSKAKINVVRRLKNKEIGDSEDNTGLLGMENLMLAIYPHYNQSEMVLPFVKTQIRQSTDLNRISLDKLVRT